MSYGWRNSLREAVIGPRAHGWLVSAAAALAARLENILYSDPLSRWCLLGFPYWVLSKVRVFGFSPLGVTVVSGLIILPFHTSPPSSVREDSKHVPPRKRSLGCRRLLPHRGTHSRFKRRGGGPLADKEHLPPAPSS